MPSAEKSHAESLARHNVTRVLARFDDCTIDVCKAGTVVALHLGTREGVVVVTIPLTEFVLKCRGPLDHNLNELPKFEDFATSESLVEPVIAPEEMGRGREMDPDQKRKFHSALKDYRKGLFRTKRAACVYHKVEHAYQTFVNWSKKPAQISPRARPLIRKPGGKLL